MAYFDRRRIPRRGAPKAPARRKKHTTVDFEPTRAGLGFESLVGAADPVPQSFFHGLDPDHRIEIPVLEGVSGASSDGLSTRGRPKDAVGASAVVHLLILALLLFNSDFGSLKPPSSPETQTPDRGDRLVLPAELVAAVPVQPAPAPAQAQPAPPQVADNGIVIPKATKPPLDPNPDFMNDLPFSQGNTDEFFTDREVNDPGEPGKEEANGESESDDGAEEIESEEPADELTEGDVKLADGRLAEERLRRRLRDFSLADPLRARPAPGSGAMARRPPTDGRIGSGGEGGTFEDIRRFLADKRFSNPDGGLVTGGPTLYYNDKGANLVPWLRRLINEVKRNWMVPYSASFRAGHVAVGVVVGRDGTVLELKNIVPSGTAGFDNAAVGAVRAADLLPLPSDYPDERFEIILVFWYNERPYDIFG